MSYLLRSHNQLSGRSELRPSSGCHLLPPSQELSFFTDLFSYLFTGSSSHIYKFVQLFFFFFISLTTKMKAPGTSLAVRWLRLHTSTAGGAGSIPGWETKIPHATTQPKKRRKPPLQLVFTLYPSLLFQVSGKSHQLSTIHISIFSPFCFSTLSSLSSKPVPLWQWPSDSKSSASL